MIYTSIFCSLVAFILYLRYTCVIRMPILIRIGLFIAVMIIGCLPLLITERMELMFGKYNTFIVHTIYFIVIMLFILLMLSVLTDILWGIGLVIFKSKMIALPSLFVLLAMSLLCSSWALYEGMKIPNIKITQIQSDKITKPVKIVFLSDLHIHRTINPRKIDGIIQRVNSLNPDILILGGDTIDDSLNKTQDIVAKLNNIQAKDGRFFVAGNHEFYKGLHKSVHFLKNLNYTFLENNGISIGQLYVAGIPDLRHSLTPVKLADTFKNALPDQYKILVSHTPADFQSQNDFDLELSGHTHGGQIFPFHILTKIYNKHFLSGLYNLTNGAKLYISRGSGQWGPQMRFLAPSEITVIELRPQQNKEQGV